MSFFTATRKTQFSESDAAGIIHFSQVAIYIEEVEHFFFQQEGYPIRLNEPDTYHWPRVYFEASYLHPILPLVEIQISLNPSRVGTTSITWDWVVKGEERDDPLASGKMKTICCKCHNGVVAPSTLPEPLKKKLTAGMTV